MNTNTNRNRVEEIRARHANAKAARDAHAPGTARWHFYNEKVTAAFFEIRSTTKEDA
jgi:hypothetical protein